MSDGRNEKAQRELKEKNYARNLDVVRLKMDYINNITNGRYFFARCNMMADQLNSGKIKEKIDGYTKTKEYLLAEYAITKRQAINGFRQAHFAKKDLIEKYKLTEEEITALEADYYDGKIIREEYNEEFKKRDKAEFVNS